MATKFTHTVDLVVADAELRDGSKLRVALLVILGPDGTIQWESNLAYPLQTWTLEQVTEDVQNLQEVAIEFWPQFSAVCDWWVPDKSYYQRIKRTPNHEMEEGDSLGLQI